VRTEGKISVRNCPNESRLQNYTGFGTSKAAMVQKCKAVLEGRGFRPKFSMKPALKGYFYPTLVYPKGVLWTHLIHGICCKSQCDENKTTDVGVSRAVGYTDAHR
jgi:hypothetical protein